MVKSWLVERVRTLVAYMTNITYISSWVGTFIPVSL
jgi:hypothetical protein